eukprot:Opistho-2@19621
MACLTDMSYDVFNVDVSYLDYLVDGLSTDMSAPGSPSPLSDTASWESKMSKFDVLTPPLSSCPSPAHAHAASVSFDSLFADVEVDVDVDMTNEDGTPVLSARKAVKSEARDAMWNGMQLASEDDIDSLLTPLATPDGIGAFDFNDEDMAAACDFVEPSKFFPTYFVGDESKISADAPAVVAPSAISMSSTTIKKSAVPPTPAQSPIKSTFSFDAEADEDEDEDEEIDVVTVTESGKRKASPLSTPLRQPPAKRQKTAPTAHIPVVPAKSPNAVISNGVRVPVSAATSAAAMAASARPRSSSGAGAAAKTSSSTASPTGTPMSAAASIAAAAAAAAAATAAASAAATAAMLADMSCSSRNMDTEAKRNTHNVLERKRRNDLKSSFHQLRESIPELEDNERAPKVLILKKAGDYIAVLRQKDAEMEALKERLRAEGRVLQERMRNARA